MAVLCESSNNRKVYMPAVNLLPPFTFIIFFKTTNILQVGRGIMGYAIQNNPPNIYCDLIISSANFYLNFIHRNNKNILIQNSFQPNELCMVAVKINNDLSADLYLFKKLINGQEVMFKNSQVAFWTSGRAISSGYIGARGNGDNTSDIIVYTVLLYGTEISENILWYYWRTKLYYIIRFSLQEGYIIIGENNSVASAISDISLYRRNATGLNNIRYTSHQINLGRC